MTSPAKPAASSAAEIEERVMAIISSKNKIPLEKIRPDTTFEELGIDSLDAVTIIFALEEEFSVDIASDGHLNVKNVRDAAQLLGQALAGRS
jgi:acyl carrier protein